jgi:proline racemase
VSYAAPSNTLISMDYGVVRTVDYHTGGEPFRIVTEPGPIAGETVAARRVTAMADPRVDGLRRLLCFEPRGHADMYGGFLVPPDDGGAHLGVLFWHKDGFSTACGHGTIALGAWAVRSGLVPVTGDRTDVVIDVPSGRVTARVHTDGGRVTSVDFVSVPSYLIAQDVSVEGHKVDVSFGGAIYAQLNAATVGLSVEKRHHQELIAIGRQIKHALDRSPLARHPSDDRLSGVYGTIIYEELGPLHQRNVTIFADGELDRSPCGSGTAARIATLAATGRLRTGETFTHDSIVGSRFTARIEETTTVDGYSAVVPCITGTAYQTGEHTFTVDPDDDLPGFVLR